MKLFLDDIRMPEKVIGVGYTQWTIARTVAEAKRLIEAARANHEPIEAMTLDHDLGACERCILDDRAIPNEAWKMVMPYCSHVGTGMDFVQWLIDTGVLNDCHTKPVVHSMNPIGKALMMAAIDRHWIK